MKNITMTKIVLYNHPAKWGRHRLSGAVVTLIDGAGNPMGSHTLGDMTTIAMIQLSLSDFTLSAFVAQTLKTLPARTIKVQSTEENAVTLAEVELYDQSDVNQALGKPSTQSNTWMERDASLAVDGDTQTFSNTFKRTGESKNSLFAVFGFAFFIISNTVYR